MIQRWYKIFTSKIRFLGTSTEIQQHRNNGGQILMIAFYQKIQSGYILSESKELADTQSVISNISMKNKM